MAGLVTKKEKYFGYNSLVSLVQCIEGKKTTVDLRNGSSATGEIVQCDAYMNIMMSHVLFRDGSGKPYILEQFFVHSRNIRYVHIPLEVNIVETLKNHFNKRKEIKKGREPVGIKHKRLLQRQAETLEEIRIRKKEIKSGNSEGHREN